jgi:uncharacterized protein
MTKLAVGGAALIQRPESWGGHPILPWMAFVLIGMGLGKFAFGPRAPRVRLLALGVGFVAVGYGARFFLESFVSESWHWALSTEPGGFGRVSPFGLGMPLYVLTTAGSSIVVLIGVHWICSRFEASLPVRVLAHAGQMTFTIYLLHGLIPWFVVSRGWVGDRFGLVGSLGIAVGCWFLAVVAGALWHRRFGIGPMEWLLRNIGGREPAAAIEQARDTARGHE